MKGDKSNMLGLNDDDEDLEDDEEDDGEEIDVDEDESSSSLDRKSIWNNQGAFIWWSFSFKVLPFWTKLNLNKQPAKIGILKPDRILNSLTFGWFNNRGQK